MTHSPFSQSKYEYESEHLYFLPNDLFSEVALDAPKPVYVIGPRGTGKTTLLKALTWNERNYNQWLRKKLPEDPFVGASGRFLGVYINIPDIQLDVLRKRVRDQSDSVSSVIFCRYFDLLWLEEVTFGLADLLAEGILPIKPQTERTLVASISSSLNEEFEAQATEVSTTKELNLYLRQRRYEMDAIAYEFTSVKRLLGPRGASQSYGSLGRRLGAQLAKLCAAADGMPGAWYFKICLDQAETLDPLQRLALHTLVRLSTWPVFPVVAFVSLPPDVEQTLLSRLPLQAADREIVDLEAYLRDTRFRQYAEGVVNVRLERLLPDISPGFDVYRTLGTLSLNSILHEKLQRSTKGWAKELLESAKQLLEHPFFTRTRAGTPADSSEDVPLVYQAYLIDRLNLTLPGPDEPNWSRRAQDSAELRKRMVAAYLSLCHELGADITFGSADMILGLADRCIRDFLRFMDFIFKESGRDLPTLLAKPVPMEIQDRGIKDASESKLRGLKASEVSTPRQTTLLVTGLGELTGALQRTADDNRHLRTSERGIFVLKLDHAVEHFKPPALNLIREAVEAAYLTLIEGTREQLCFRVHASLAPIFSFSYRGAYYRVTLDWGDLERILNATDRKQLAALAHHLTDHGGTQDSLTLF